MIKLKCKAEDCNTEFLPSTPAQLYCSDRCRYRQHKRETVAQRIVNGACTQCGGEWIEPLETHKGKPKHCRKCQEYWQNRYAKD